MGVVVVVVAVVVLVTVVVVVVRIEMQLRGKRSLMVRCVVGSILHGVDTLRYFSFQPVLQDWCNKGYPVCGMVHIKEPLLLIGKNSLYGAAGFLSHYLNGPLP